MFSLENLINLITLTGLEIVLGVDNVIFIALLVEPFKDKLRQKIRLSGLSIALALRIILLFFASKIMGLVQPLFSFLGHEFSGKSLLLIFGGLFLVVKSIFELIDMFKVENSEVGKTVRKQISVGKTIAQVVFIDFILSFDSVITAVGVSNNLPIIITAIIISMIIMVVSSKSVGEFIYKHNSIKVIALAFILLVGVFLIFAGFNYEFDKKCLYFAMFFSLLVEIINIRLNKKNSEA